MKAWGLFLMFCVLTFSYSTAYGAQIPIGGPYLHPKDPSSHRSVTATVKRIASDMVFFRTEEGTIRTHGMKEIRRDGLPSIKPGDQVDLILDRRANTIIVIAPPAGTGAYVGNQVTGSVRSFDWFSRRIVLETQEEGEMLNLELRDAALTKLIGVAKGRPVVLELDRHDLAFDAYRSE